MNDPLYNELYADGIHDDTETIQKLIDKGYTWLPPGKYKITKTIQLPLEEDKDEGSR